MAKEKQGFIKLNRGFFDNFLWNEARTYSKAEAWLDLIQMARFEASVEIIGGKVIELQRGEIPASRRYLELRWNWGSTKVSNFLKMLTDFKMIKQSLKSGQTIIFLLNFGIYNDTQTTNKPEANQRRTSNKPEANQNKELQEGKELNNILLEKESKEINQKNENSENEDLDFEPINPDTKKRKKVAQKKENTEPPDLETFIQFAKEIYQNELKINFSPYEFAVRSKYQSWIDAGWKDGNKKQILVWKNKLRNTIPHLKPIYGNSNSYNANNGFTSNPTNTQRSNSGKTSARTILAKRLSAENESFSDGSGGNFTADAEIVE